MFCTKCGNKLNEHARFCTSCGTPLSSTPAGVPQVNAAEEPKPVDIASKETRPLGEAVLLFNGPGEHQVSLPFEGSIIIGRGDDGNPVDLDLTEQDNGLFSSRYHAEIRCSYGQYVLRDRGSRNGTWVNGRKLVANEETCLQPGDEIVFARVPYRFMWKES